MKLNKIGLVAFIFIVFFVLVVLFVMFLRFRNRSKIKIDGKNGIQKSFFLDIGGMKQYIQIRGENAENPVMIFVHGGPASPMGYVSAYYQKELESGKKAVHLDALKCNTPARRLYESLGFSPAAERNWHTKSANLTILKDSCTFRKVCSAGRLPALHYKIIFS